MHDLQLFARLGLALAIGLLIGVERGWRGREAKEGTSAAGIRTFTLIGLLGGVWAALAGFAGPLALGFAAAAFAVGFALFEWNEARATNSLSAVGLIAGLLTFALGALAGFGATSEAAACAVAAALFLAERTALHSFVERLRWSELRAALILLAMTVVMLPLLPNRTVDVWNSINPYQIWAMTAAIAALSYVGYICVRTLGERRGLLVGAAAAALVSSTAVTINYSALPRSDLKERAAISAGILLAWAVSLLRVFLIALFIAPPLWRELTPAIAGAIGFLSIVAAIFYLRSDGIVQRGDEGLREPFDIGLVLRFGVLLAAVMLAYKITVNQFGNMGLLPLAAVSGAADVDPITLAVARSAGTSVAFDAAAQLILVAASANFVVRAVVVGATRDIPFVLPLLSAGIATFVIAWAMLVLVRL